METEINGISYEKTRALQYYHDEAHEAMGFDFSPHDGRA